MRWTAGAWSSDAEFLCWATTAGFRRLVFCNGSYVEYGGEKILAAEALVRSCEVTSTGGKTEIVSSDKEAVVLRRPLEDISADSEAALASVHGSSRTDA
jgi:hypothetical protein